MLKIAVLISGNGSNLQAIMDSIASGNLNCCLEMVISDNSKAFGLKRAEDRNVKTYIVDKKTYGYGLSKEILKLTENNVDLIVLAGFLSILSSELTNSFRNRIINIHPSLIPSFCGDKMYGLKVHEAAIGYGVKYSGCTVHFVDEGIDTGKIICQRIVPVYTEDTAESLQKRILVEEHMALTEAIKTFCS